MAEAVLSETERSLLDERGFVVLEDAIAADQADALRDRSMALAEQERAASGRHVYLGDTAQRVWNLVDKGEVFEQAIQHPRVLGAMTYLLGPDCTLSSFTVNVIGPGAPAGDLHVDHPLGPLPTPRPGFPLSANSIWFLDDFTVKNGATRCVPGSHRRLEALPEPGVRYDDEVQITGARGSVMIMNGALWHASSANRTDRERVCLLGFFCRAFLKPQQDQIRIVSDEVVQRATPTLKRLLGFDSRPNTLA